MTRIWCRRPVWVPLLQLVESAGWDGPARFVDGPGPAAVKAVNVVGGMLAGAD
jgi:hypothetical protein